MQTVSAEFAVDLDNSLRLAKPIALWLGPVTDVFQLKIYQTEVQSCFVSVT